MTNSHSYVGKDSLQLVRVVWDSVQVQLEGCSIVWFLDSAGFVFRPQRVVWEYRNYERKPSRYRCELAMFFENVQEGEVEGDYLPPYTLQPLTVQFGFFVCHYLGNSFQSNRPDNRSGTQIYPLRHFYRLLHLNKVWRRTEISELRIKFRDTN